MTDQPPDLPVPPIGSGGTPPPPDGWSPPADPTPAGPPPSGAWGPPGAAPPPTGGWVPPTGDQGPATGAPTGDAPLPGQPSGGGGPLPPYPPVGYPAALPLDDGRVVGRRVSRGLLVAAVAVVVAGAGFAIFSLAGGGGSTSPEDAVDDLLTSLSDEDAIGMLETVRPAEREALQGPLEDTVSEMERLDLLADVDLTDFQGVDVELEGYQLLTTELHDGVVAVTVSGGEVTGAATPQDLPLGDTLRDILEDDLDVEISDDTESETTDIGEFQLVAVRDGGSWYVSPGYSIAEAARQASDAPLPPFDGSVVPVGGESPEASVQALAAAAVDLDVEAVITQLDPAEMAALYDYAPLFLDDAQDVADDALDGTEVSFELTDLAAEDGPGDTQRVVVRGFEASVEMDNEYEQGSYTMSYDGECFRYEGESTYQYFDTIGEYDDEYVDDEQSDVETEATSGEWCEGEQPVIDGESTDDFSGLPEMSAPFGELSVITVERDGRWYVAPTRSFLELIPAALRGIEPSDIDDLREWFDEFWGTASFEEFDEVGEAIDLCEDGYDEDGFCEVGPPMTFEPSPIDDCYIDLEDSAFADDPVHADMDEYGERRYYLQEQVFQACIQELVDAGDLDEAEAESYSWSDPCWAAYEGLDADATADDWAEADDEVEACFEDIDYGFPEEPEETIDPVDPTDADAVRDALIEEFGGGEYGADDEFAICMADGLLAELGAEEALALIRDESGLPPEGSFDVLSDLLTACFEPSGINPSTTLPPTSTVPPNA